jgi:N-methylhydantoinase B
MSDSTATRAELVVTSGGRPSAQRDAGDRIDPVTTEILRQSLVAAAEQMKRALMRTSFSPIIHEVLDFAAALYDRDVCMLSQADSLPAFMGTMSFCVDAAVEAVGGPEALEPGDIVVYNVPYGSGSHPQDASLVMPVFVGGQLIGYSAIKAHWLDIGAKDPYCTDTVDVFQEGMVLPGVKLCTRGEMVPDVLRLILANSRVPKVVEGDINATVVGVRTGAAALARIVERHGVETFEQGVQQIYEHGERLVRTWIESLPDGRYVGHAAMDSDGITDDLVTFETAMEIDGSTVRVDFSASPPHTAGPINCPLPATVSAARVAIAQLAGGGEAPNEGFFRPIEVITRPGTLFHALSPAPCFLYGWAAEQAMEGLFESLAAVAPDGIPADSGGDVCALVWWGDRNRRGEAWADGAAHPIGQGAHTRGDGAHALMHHSEAATRLAPVEVWEARNPWVVERLALAADSCGAGRHRGGLGLDVTFRLVEDAWLTSALEHTKRAPKGFAGGTTARANAIALELPDGTTVRFGKVTRLRVPAGAAVHLRTGGGGGYGDPSGREPEAVRSDLREGYISEAHAREHYPHVALD